MLSRCWSKNCPAAEEITGSLVDSRKAITNQLSARGLSNFLRLSSFKLLTKIFYEPLRPSFIAFSYSVLAQPEDPNNPRAQQLKPLETAYYPLVDNTR